VSKEEPDMPERYTLLHMWESYRSAGFASDCVRVLAEQSSYAVENLRNRCERLENRCDQAERAAQEWAEYAQTNNEALQAMRAELESLRIEVQSLRAEMPEKLH